VTLKTFGVVEPVVPEMGTETVVPPSHAGRDAVPHSSAVSVAVFSSGVAPWGAYVIVMGQVAGPIVSVQPCELMVKLELVESTGATRVAPASICTNTDRSTLVPID
jgi:hypothetical protein